MDYKGCPKIWILQKIYINAALVIRRGYVPGKYLLLQVQ